MAADRGAADVVGEKAVEDGMTGSEDLSSGMNANTVLRNCPDFREKKSALQEVVRVSRVCLDSVNEMPEPAGIGHRVLVGQD